MSNLNEFKLKDLWENDDAVMMASSDQDMFKDPFITLQSPNLLYSGKRLSPTQMIKGTENLDMNIPLSSDPNTDGFDLLRHHKSPWHESDSGVSTMSEAGSPSGLDFPPSENLVQPIVDWSALGEGAEDLASYLLGTDVSMLQNDGSVPLCQEKQNFESEMRVLSPHNNIPVVPISINSKPILPIYSNDVDLDLNVDVENSDSECSHNGGISPERPNSQISEPLNYFQEVCGEGKRKPGVKIVKVLKTTAGSDYCDDEIVKALDERSRKNAIQAKMNREKKKKYLNSLEQDVEKLGKENDDLRNENTDLKRELGSLEEEVRYLKSVLVNASPLASMLRNISEVSEVKLSASIVGRKRVASDCDDHSYTATAKGKTDNSRAERSAKRAKMVQDNLEKAGVCLHVCGSEASLEFCAQCSSLSRRSQRQTKKS